jgi:CRP-like cAMP-binding protein
MVASTLKLPFEARSEVKLKLLRGFCRDVSIFERLDVDAEEQQTDICRHMGLQEVDPHEIIFSQGSSGDTAYCLLSGSVQIAVHGRHVRTLRFGETFCFGALDGETIKSASAVTIEATALLTLSRPAYLKCSNGLLFEAIQCLKKSADERTALDIELVRSMIMGASFFNRLHYEEPQRHACRCMSVREVPSGDLIFKIGDAGDLFYFILEGTVAIIIDGEEKKQLSTNESFGEMALVGETAAARRRTATVVAKEPCTFAVMGRDDFVKVNKGFEDSFVEVLLMPPNKRTNEHLAQLSRMFLDLSFFKGLGIEVARKNAMRYLRFEAWDGDHELFHSGQAGDKFYVLIRGEVKIMEGSVRNGFVEVNRLISGTAFGELGIVADEPGKRVRTATVITTQHCIFATLGRESYMFVTAIAKLKPLIDKFWKLAAGDPAWEDDAELPLFIGFPEFRRLQLRLNKVFAEEDSAAAMKQSSDADLAMEDAVLTKWKQLVNTEQEAGSQVLGYSDFTLSFFERFYSFLGGIDAAILYRQCISLMLQTISDDKGKEGGADGEESAEFRVYKKMSKVVSQRKIFRHYKGKYQKAQEVQELADKNSEMEMRAKWKNPDKAGTGGVQILPALKVLKDIKTAKLLQGMFGAAAGLGSAAEAEVLSDEQDPEEAAEVEERISENQNRFKQAGAKFLDNALMERLRTGQDVSLHTVVAAARNRNTMNARQQNIEKHVLSRRQRAYAIMSGSQIDAVETSYGSHTESSSAVEHRTGNDASPVKNATAKWAKTEKWEPEETGTRDFEKDPVKPRYLSLKTAGEVAVASSPITKVTAAQTIPSPLRPLRRTLFEIESSSGGHTGDIGIYRMPVDKHARAKDGVHENRARYTGDLGQHNYARQVNDPVHLAGRTLVSAEAAQDSAVRAVVHNGRSTATNMLRSQEDFQTTREHFEHDYSSPSPSGATRGSSRSHRRPTEQEVPLMVPETMKTGGSSPYGRPGGSPHRRGIATAPSPGAGRRLSPLQKTAPVVLAEFAKHQDFLRAKTPWTGGGFRRPRDHEDLALLYGQLQDGDALEYAAAAMDHPIVIGDPFMPAAGVWQRGGGTAESGGSSSSISFQGAAGGSPGEQVRTASRGMVWGSLAGSQQPWGEAHDDVIHAAAAAEPRMLSAESSHSCRQPVD